MKTIERDVRCAVGRKSRKARENAALLELDFQSEFELPARKNVLGAGLRDA
jgi:hypothetical protein